MAAVHPPAAGYPAPGTGLAAGVMQYAIYSWPSREQVKLPKRIPGVGQHLMHMLALRKEAEAAAANQPRGMTATLIKKGDKEAAAGA